MLSVNWTRTETAHADSSMQSQHILYFQPTAFNHTVQRWNSPQFSFSGGISSSHPHLFTQQFPQYSEMICSTTPTLHVKWEGLTGRQTAWLNKTNFYRKKRTRDKDVSNSSSSSSFFICPIFSAIKKKPRNKITYPVILVDSPHSWQKKNKDLFFMLKSFYSHFHATQ